MLFSVAVLSLCHPVSLSVTLSLSLSRSLRISCCLVGPQAKEPKASVKVDSLNATFQPTKIGNAHGLQITFLSDNSTRNLFVYHADGKVSQHRPLLDIMCHHSFEGKLYSRLVWNQYYKVSYRNMFYYIVFNVHLIKI